MNFNQNGWGTTFFNFVLGGGNKFYERTVFWKKMCYVVVFTTILQLFRLLINYVAVCKLYSNILNINVYLYKLCFIYSFNFPFCKWLILMWNHFARSAKNFFRVGFGHIFQVFFCTFFNTLYPKFLDKTLNSVIFNARNLTFYTEIDLWQEKTKY